MLGSRIDRGMGVNIAWSYTNLFSYSSWTYTASWSLKYVLSTPLWWIVQCLTYMWSKRLMCEPQILGVPGPPRSNFLVVLDGPSHVSYTLIIHYNLYGDIPYRFWDIGHFSRPNITLGGPFGGSRTPRSNLLVVLDGPCRVSYTLIIHYMMIFLTVSEILDILSTKYYSQGPFWGFPGSSCIGPNPKTIQHIFTVGGIYPPNFNLIAQTVFSVQCSQELRTRTLPKQTKP